MASFTVSCTDTTVTMRVSGLKSGQKVRFYVRIDPGSTVYVDRTYTATSSSLSRSFSGLKPSTDYACNVKLDDTTWIGTRYFTTDSPEIKVEPWSWSRSNGDASASQTSAAYSAVRNKGKVSGFSYLVWNDMVNKVKEILDAKGLSWNNRFASYAGTLMSSGSRTLTATKFNSLRYNIGLHYSTGIDTVFRGDTVYGWYFTTLTSCMNYWLNN